MNFPEKGFYYHYKHDPQNGIDDCLYEVVGTAFSTESAGVHSDNPEDFFEDEVVIYRPVFSDSLVLKAGRDFWTRPVKMFLENIEKDGVSVPRFTKVTDPDTIEKLGEIRDTMYN